MKKLNRLQKMRLFDFKGKDVYFYAFLGLMLLVTIFLYFDILTHRKLIVFADIGVDTVNNYMAMYEMIVNGLKNLKFTLWSFQTGIGTSNLAISSLIFDPFNIFMFLLPTEKLLMGITLGVIARIWVIGIVFYCYLQKLNFNGYARIMGALAWAFNGYIMLWGQHFMFATGCVYFTLIIYGLELFLREKKNIIFVVSIFLCALNSPYVLYSVTIFLLIYYIFHCLLMNSTFSVVEFIKKGIQVLIRYIIGLGLSSVIFVPTCYILLSSPRVGISGLPPILIDKLFSISAMTRFFSNNALGTNDYFGARNYYEIPILYGSILMLILSIHVFSKSTIRKKIIFGAGFLLFFMSLEISYVPFIFNAMSTVAYRWTYILVFAIILCGSYSLNDIINSKEVNKKMISIFAVSISFLTIICILYVCAFPQIETSNEVLFFTFKQLLVSLLIIYVICVILFNINAKNYKTTAKLLIFILIIDLSYNNYYTLYRRDNLPLHLEHIYHDKTTDLIKDITTKDDSFYRLDKNFFTVLHNDSMVQNYYGINSYHNLNAAGYIEFCQALENVYPYTLFTTNLLGSIDNNKRIQDFLGVKYFITNKILNNDEFEFLYSKDDLNVYRNLDMFPLGFAYEQYITSDMLTDSTAIEKMDTLLNNAVVTAPLEGLTLGSVSKGNLVDFRSITAENVAEGSNLVAENLEYTAISDDPQLVFEPEQMLKNDFIIKFDITVPQSTSCQIFLKTGQDVFNEEKMQQLTLEPTQVSYSIPVYNKNVSQIRLDIGNIGEHVVIHDFKVIDRGSVGDAITEKSPMQIDSFRETHIQGHIESKVKSLLVFTIPYDKGWSIHVDGKLAPVIKADYGMMSVELEQGHHDLELRYFPYGMKIGIAISVVTLIGVISFFSYKKYKFKDLLKPEKTNL